MKVTIQELREIIRWRLHSLADLAFDQVQRSGYPVRAYRVWLWLAVHLDRLAGWIGGPLGKP